jgi:hypothetical protein
VKKEITCCLPIFHYSTQRELSVRAWACADLDLLSGRRAAPILCYVYRQSRSTPVRGPDAHQATHASLTLTTSACPLLGSRFGPTFDRNSCRAVASSMHRLSSARLDPASRLGTCQQRNMCLPFLILPFNSYNLYSLGRNSRMRLIERCTAHRELNGHRLGQSGTCTICHFWRPQLIRT